MTINTSGNLNVAGVGNLVGLNVTGITTLNSDTHVVGNLTSQTVIADQGIFSGNLNIAGNIIYNEVVYDSTSNLVFVLGNNQSSGTFLNGAGLQVGNTGLATWQYNLATNSWQSNIDITPAANITQNLGNVVNYWGNIFVRNAAIPGNLIVGTVNGAFVGNADGLFDLNGANIIGTVPSANVVTDNAQPNITSVGTLTSVSVTGNIRSGGILTDGYYYANGTPVSFGGGGSDYSNANVAAYLPTYTGNLTAGNILTDNYLYANGQPFTPGTNYSNANVAAYLPTYSGILSGSATGLVAIPGANVTGTVAQATQANSANTANAVAGANVSGTVSSATTAATVTTAAQPNITSVGTLTSLTVNGNTQSGNLLTTGRISALGNIQGNVFIGNGSQLTGLPSGYSNAQAAAYFASGTNSSDIDITGSILTTAEVSAVGNITGNVFIGDGSQLTGVYANANVAAYLPTYTGNLNTGNAVVTGNLQVQGTTTTVNTTTLNVSNITVTIGDGANTGAPLDGGGLLLGNNTAGNTAVASWVYSYPDNAWTSSIDISLTGNVLASGNITATGNIRGAYVLGNIAAATGGYGNANVASYMPTYTGALSRVGAIITTSNISGAYLLGNIAAATGGYDNTDVAAYMPTYLPAYLPTYDGNLTAGNLSVAGTVSASGIVQGAYLVGNIASATGGYSNTNVAAYLPTYLPTYVGNINAGNAVITGNLQVQGTTTTVNTSILAVANVNIIVGANTNVSSALNGGGLLVGNNQAGNTPAASWTYDYTNSAWTSNQLAIIGANVIGSNILTAGQVSATGNAYAGNILTAGNVSAAGNVYAGNIVLTDIINAGAVQSNYWISAGSYILANTYISAVGNVISGNLLTAGQLSAAGNVTGANYLGTTISVSGNVTSGNVRTAGQVSATGVITSAANINGSNFNTVGLISATANVVGGNLRTAGQVTATGNVVAGNILTAGLLSATGNVTGGNLSVIGQVNAGGILIGGGTAISGASAVGAYSGTWAAGGTNIKLSNNLGSGNIIGNVSGNVAFTALQTGFDVPNALTSGSVSSLGNITGGNIVTAGQVSATGNITGNVFLGNGSQLTGVVATNIGTLTNLTVTGNITGGNLSVGANVISGTGNIYAANVLVSGLQSVTGNVNTGNLLTAGLVSAVGNVTGGNIRTAGQVSASGAVYALQVSTGGNIVTAQNITATGTIIAATLGTVGVNIGSGNVGTGNVSASGQVVAGTVSASGTIQSASTISGNSGSFNNIFSTNVISGTGNVTGGNILTAGLVSATGNITGNVFIGNGSQLTGVVATNIGTLTNLTVTGTITGGNVSVGANTISGTGSVFASVVSATANVTGGNILTAGLLSATANITGGNIVTAGLVSAAANITGGNILTAGLVSATANITAGNILTAGRVSAQGNIYANTGSSIFAYGTTTSGFGAVYTGPTGYVALPSTTIQVTANANTYAQMNAQNLNNGNQASTDYVATADNGSDTQMFVDLGIAGSNYANSSANNALGTSVANNDAYLYTVGSTATGNTVGGNLVIGTVGTGRQVKFIAGGSASGNIVMTLAAPTATTAVAVTGNLSVSGNITGGNLVTTGTLSISGNIATGAFISASGAVYANASSAIAFVSGPGAASNVALLIQPPANVSIPANQAIRDLSVANTVMYFDAGMGSANTGHSFQFRGSNAFTTYANINSSGINSIGPIKVGGNQQTNGPTFFAYNNSSQSIPTDVQTKLTFDTEDWDTNNNFTSSRFTPTVAGYYQISGSVRISNVGTGERMITIWKNGTEYVRAFNDKGSAAVGDSWFQMSISQPVYMNGSTDYVELYMQHGAGTNQSTTAGRAFTNFSGIMVRGA